MSGRTRAFRGLRTASVSVAADRAAAADQAAASVAEAMWAVARVEEQCARTILDDVIAASVRKRIRWLASSDGVKIRTARIGDSVIVVRLDAKVWSDDAATMRRKLTPM